MIQRLDPRSVEEQLGLAKEELLPHFQNLAEVDYQHLSSPESAELIGNMLKELTNPMVGIPLMRYLFTLYSSHLAQADFPFMNQYTMLFDKAQIFYFQSILQDLNRLQLNQPLIEVSKQEIRQCVEDIHWKVNVEKSSLHDSQEIGENIDLMKFFEGVRNYQNWNQNIKKQCLERLKQQSRVIELDLTLRRGFFAAKIQQIVKKYRDSNLSKLFQIDRKQKSHLKIAKILSFFQANRLREGFNLISEHSRQHKKSVHQFNVMVKQYTKRRVIHDIKSAIQAIKIKKDKISKFSTFVTQIRRKKELLLKVAVFKHLNLKPVFKAAHITSAMQKMTSICKAIAVRRIIKQVNYPPKVIFSILSRSYLRIIQQPFGRLKDNLMQIKLYRPNVSDKVKIKYLLSLDKHQKQPMSLKKVLNRWYINTHEQKFSKKIYNIWLKGNISKFSFFMRIKNLCNQSKKKMFGKEIKHFLGLLCDKFDKYEEHQVKHKLIQWVENTRRLRKIQGMFSLLTKITNETHEYFEKNSVKKILSFCKTRKIVKNYLSLYLKNYIEKRQAAISTWGRVNNIKKQWGRQKLRNNLLNTTNQTTMTLQQSLNELKRNWQEGKQKKLKVLRKTINTDVVFMSSFFHAWRYNEKKNQMEETIAVNRITENKINSIMKISAVNSISTQQKLKYIINKFKKHKELKSKRIQAVKNRFLKVVGKNEEYLLKQTLTAFIDNLRQGLVKKERLVTNLVHANFVKEKLVFSIIRSKAHHYTDLLKIERLSKVHEMMQETIKENMVIFNNKLFVSKVLQKIISNRASNACAAFNIWKTMPLRMRWNLRKKVIKLSDTLNGLRLERFNSCNHIFKSSLVESKMRRRKAVYIMACKYELNLKKWFIRYRTAAAKMKQEHQMKTVIRTFETFRTQSKQNFDIIMVSEPEWPKKKSCFQFLDKHLKIRFRGYLLAWQNNSQTIKHYQQVVGEKKKRVLLTVNRLLQQQKIQITRRTVETFDKNRRIHNLQTNFLKKLCEGKVGKLMNGFMKWKVMPEPKDKKKIFNASSFVVRMQNILKVNLQRTLSIFNGYKRKGQEKKYQGINKLVAVKCGDIGNYFQRWLYHKRLVELNIKNGKVEQVFDNILNHHQKSFKMLFKGDQVKNKIRSLELVQNYWNRQKLYCIKKWYHNMSNLRIRGTNQRHLLLSLSNIQKQSNSKLINQKVVLKFKNNRDVLFRQKKQKKVGAILQTLESKDAFRRMVLNQTVDKLKYNHYRGNFLKSQAFHKFLRQKIGNVHGCLSIWNSLAIQAKQSHKQRIVTQNFDSINETVASHFRLILTRGKQLMIMKGALDKIFLSQEIKFKAYFNLWRQRLVEIRMAQELGRQTKGVILERINKIINATSNQAVAETIKKFHMNMKIQKVQRKFIERLMQTKSGKVIHAFSSWKTIPYNQKLGKFKKYQKFYFGVEAFYKNRLKQVHTAFTTSQEDGNLMKKQSILKLFEMTSLGIRRFYNRWTRLTKQKHTLMQVNKTINTFQSVEASLANQYMIIFQDQRAYRIKIAAINKLIEASKSTTQNYFNSWRENTKMIKLHNDMGVQKKKIALSMFNKVMGNSSTGQVLSTISLFKKNASMVRISKNFFNRLMSTKTGKLLKFFEKLKTVPDAKLNQRKKRGIIFESRLNNFVLKRFRFALAPFKDNTYEANIKKKYCLDRLSRACMGQNKKKFLIWRNVVRQGKMLKHTSLFQTVFTNVENTYRNNFLVINKDTKSQIHKKKNLCRKLISNSLFVQDHAYLLWKQAYHIDDIKIKEKQNSTQGHLRNLFQVCNNHQNRQTVQAINSFRKVLEIANLVKSHHHKNYKNQKLLEFYNCLKTRELSHKNILVSALKANQAQFVLSQKSKRLHSSFQSILEGVQVNMNKMFKSDLHASFLQKMFTQLYNNQLSNMRRSLSIWQEKRVSIRHKEQDTKGRKKEALSKLNHLISIDKNTKMQGVFKSFKSFSIDTEAKKRYLTRLLSRRGDNIRSAYYLWKVLPYQQAKKLKQKATLFENKLQMFLQNRLKEVHSTFKYQNQAGRTKKQNSARNIVKCRLVDMNTCFFKWRKANNENRVKQKIVNLGKTFSTIQEVVKSNITIFDDSRIADQRKVRATTQLFNRNVMKLKSCFGLWRSNTKGIKLQLFQRFMRPFNPEDMNKRLMKISFLMIEKKNDLQSMKGYINSLWKWKMSNVQATYYSKFIKVFKESEEMVHFSNLVTKKYCQHTHFAFRNILEMGHQRSNRKRQIVQKYLTKRVRNYLMAFKQATNKTEVNIWKSKYTGSIKAKISFDVLSALILKSKNTAIQQLKGYYDYTARVQLFAQKYRKYSLMEAQKAFDEIRWSGEKKFISILDRLQVKSHQSTLKENFCILNNYNNISKLEEIISRTVFKSLLNKGFNKIRQRKEKTVNAHLSIVLLQTLTRQQKKNQQRQVVRSFGLNRTRHIGVEKIFRMSLSKYQDYIRAFLEQSSKLVTMNRLLLRFKRGLAIQKVLQKQDQKLKRGYLLRMRRKENKWMQLAIKKFATRASVRSSPAVCLWRLKTYVMNT